METIVQTFGLSKMYKQQKALFQLDMQIKKGDIYGLVGKNGAGKTTLIKLLFGLSFPSSGMFDLFGVSNEDNKIEDARKRINGIVEQPTFYPYMSAQQNLKAYALMRGISNEGKIRDVLEKVGLSETGRKKVRNFSLGMKQRLGIARALLTDAELIILDEPTNGLDPSGIMELRELIKDLNHNHNITFLISSHYIAELEHVINRFGIIDEGQIIEEESLKAIHTKLPSKLSIDAENVEDCATVMKEKYSRINIIDNTVVIEQPIKNINELYNYLSEKNINIYDIKRETQSLEEYILQRISKQGNH